MNKPSESQLKEQQQKILPSGSTEMLKDSYALPMDQDIPLSVSLHRSCKTLSIAGFKQAHCNNDLSPLIIEGTPTPDELKDAWDEIVFEYATLFKNEDSQYLFELSQRISLLKIHIGFVDYAVVLLRAKFNSEGNTDHEILNELNTLGYDIQFDESNPQAYIQALNRIVSLCKTNVFDLEEQEKEYNRLNKTTEGKKQSEEDFDANIMMLSKYQHFPIDEEKVTVYKYAIIFNNYMREMTMRNKSAEANA